MTKIAALSLLAPASAVERSQRAADPITDLVGSIADNAIHIASGPAYGLALNNLKTYHATCVASATMRSSSAAKNYHEAMKDVLDCMLNTYLVMQQANDDALDLKKYVGQIAFDSIEDSTNNFPSKWLLEFYTGVCRPMYECQELTATQKTATPKLQCDNPAPNACPAIDSSTGEPTLTELDGLWDKLSKYDGTNDRFMSPTEKTFIGDMKNVMASDLYGPTLFEEGGRRNYVVRSQDQQAWSWCAQQEKSQDYCFKVVVDTGPALIGNATKAWNNVIATGLASEATMKANTKIIADHISDAAKESIVEMQKRQKALDAIANAGDNPEAMKEYQKTIGTPLGHACVFTTQCQAAGSIFGSGSGKALTGVDGKNIDGATNRLTSFCHKPNDDEQDDQKGVCSICTPPRPRKQTVEDINSNTTYATGQHNVQRGCMCITDSDCAIGRGSTSTSKDYSRCDDGGSLSICVAEGSHWKDELAKLTAGSIAYKTMSDEIAVTKAAQDAQVDQAPLMQSGCVLPICNSLAVTATINDAAAMKIVKQSEAYKASAFAIPPLTDEDRSQFAKALFDYGFGGSQGVAATASDAKQARNSKTDAARQSKAQESKQAAEAAAKQNTQNVKDNQEAAYNKKKQLQDLTNNVADAQKQLQTANAMPATDAASTKAKETAVTKAQDDENKAKAALAAFKAKNPTVTRRAAARLQRREPIKAHEQ